MKEAFQWQITELAEQNAPVAARTTVWRSSFTF
jgi:hypothetical protein